MNIDIQFRGERWQLNELTHGVQYATQAHNMYRRNNALEPLRRNEKSTELPTSDFLFARSFFLHDDKFVATENRLDFATTQVNGDLSRRMYFVENGLLQFLAYNEIPQVGDANPYPTPTINGHRSGVPAPTTLYASGVNNDAIYGLEVTPLIRELANENELGDGTVISYENLPEEEKSAYVETVYVYTYVNKYGEEGPPSLPSRSVYVRSDSTVVQVSGIEYSDNPDIVGIRLYCLVEGDYYLVGASVTQVGATATTAAITDLTFLNNTLGGIRPAASILFSADTVKTRLISAEWEQAPDGMKHLASLDDGILAVASDNTIHLSHPYHWHAFPVANEYTVNGTIIRLARINGGMAVLTDRGTHFFFGSDPIAFFEASVVFPYPITDPDSLCIIDEGIGYVCKDGFAVLDNNGGRLVTDGFIDRESWIARIKLDECRCELYEGRVLMATRDPENNDPKGYMLNLAMREITSFDLDEPAINAGFFRDPRNNDCHYVIDAAGLAIFNRGDQHVAIWESGDIIVPDFHSFNTALVEAQEYVTDGSMTVTMILPNGQEYPRVITSNRPVRIRPNNRTGRFRIRVQTGKNIAFVRLGAGVRSV